MHAQILNPWSETQQYSELNGNGISTWGKQVSDKLAKYLDRLEFQMFQFIQFYWICLINDKKNSYSRYKYHPQSTSPKLFCCTMTTKFEPTTLCKLTKPHY